MSQKTLLLFDFDGTIADTAAIVMEVGNEVLRQYGMDEVPESEFEAMRAKSAPDLIKQFRVPLRKIPAIVTSVRQSLKQRIDVVQPIEGMLELIQDLAKKNEVTLIVLSSNSLDNVDFFLKKFGIRDCFASIHADVGVFSKYTKIRRITRTVERGARVVSIGDETRDVEAARIAKVPAIAVDWGLSARSKLEKSHANHVVSTVPQLKKAILSYIK